MKQWMVIAALGLAISPMSLYAQQTELITIIGPDGRPMNIERQRSQPKTVPKLANRPVSIPKSVAVATPVPAAVTEPKQSSTEVAVVNASQQPATQAAIVAAPVATAVQTPMPATPAPTPSPSKPSETVVKTPSTKGSSEAVVASNSPTLATAKQATAFVELEGETYVDSDYLEQAEFNLEGKKRFYHIPGVDGAPVEVIERKKGLNLGFFNRLQQKETAKDVPVVFAATYTRVEQGTVQEMLAQQCLDKKQLKQAKTFHADKPRHLWPSKPIQAEFDFSLVKLEHAMQDVHITSFAANDQRPSFYWPFVVFLNEQGCVQEGVMGFRTGQQEASALKHPAIEGVIRIPEHTKYILMTPLEAAIDAEDLQLTNEGQLKLVALR